MSKSPTVLSSHAFTEPPRLRPSRPHTVSTIGDCTLTSKCFETPTAIVTSRPGHLPRKPEYPELEVDHACPVPLQPLSPDAEAHGIQSFASFGVQLEEQGPDMQVLDLSFWHDFSKADSPNYSCTENQAHAPAPLSHSGISRFVDRNGQFHEVTDVINIDDSSDEDDASEKRSPMRTSIQGLREKTTKLAHVNADHLCSADRPLMNTIESNLTNACSPHHRNYCPVKIIAGKRIGLGKYEFRPERPGFDGQKDQASAEDLACAELIHDVHIFHSVQPLNAGRPREVARLERLTEGGRAEIWLYTVLRSDGRSMEVVENLRDDKVAVCDVQVDGDSVDDHKDKGALQGIKPRSYAAETAAQAMTMEKHEQDQMELLTRKEPEGETRLNVRTTKRNTKRQHQRIPTKMAEAKAQAEKAKAETAEGEKAKTAEANGSNKNRHKMQREIAKAEMRKKLEETVRRGRRPNVANYKKTQVEQPVLFKSDMKRKLEETVHRGCTLRTAYEKELDVEHPVSFKADVTKKLVDAVCKGHRPSLNDKEKEDERSTPASKRQRLDRLFENALFNAERRPSAYHATMTNQVRSTSVVTVDTRFQRARAVEARVKAKEKPRLVRSEFLGSLGERQAERLIESARRFDSNLDSGLGFQRPEPLSPSI